MSTPFGSSTSPSSPFSPANSAPDRVAFDNLLRRELKVSDPTDAQQVASALVLRFKDDPRTIAIQQEAQGLPFLQMAAPAPVAAGPMASDAEWKQAVDDVEGDLKELTTSSLLKDVQPELTGWTHGIRTALQEASGAARFGLDPRMRDKTFAIRRQLGEYAWLARVIGSLSSGARNEFRQLARSLDEAAAVVLVKLGEALANAGFGGNFLMQVPYTELQTRRDAVIYALRNLIGATQEAFSPNEWPRGLDAYRQLFEGLEAQGLGDLRSLLVENELTRTMDVLLQRAGNGTPEGMRALGATAEIDLVRFRRLVVVASSLVRPASPPMTSFIEALKLFADAFTSSGGYRLLRIARPPLLTYGLYGARHSFADGRLATITGLRSALADLTDCFDDCGCDVKLQAETDLALYATDRAIDLYAVGSDDFGPSEARASAYAYLLWSIRGALREGRANARKERQTERARILKDVIETSNAIIRLLAPFNRLGEPRLSTTTFDDFIRPVNILARDVELNMQLGLAPGWERIVGALALGCSMDGVVDPGGLMADRIGNARRANRPSIDDNNPKLIHPPSNPIVDKKPPAGTIPFSKEPLIIPPQYEKLLLGISDDARTDQ
jgi:hypothetical protein